eukprot:686342-Pyramimonas_sp.AAC.1
MLAECGAEQRFPGCTDGLNLVMAGRERESPAAEVKVRAWGRGLVKEGRARGFRPPAPEERARAVGLAGDCR